MARAKIKKRWRINGRFAPDGKILTMPARRLEGRAVSLHARTPAGHSGWRSESGSRGQGLVTSALGRLRDNARPALRPACESIAGLGQAGAGHARLFATSQEARLELSGGVGSLPQEPRWNAGRRAAPSHSLPRGGVPAKFAARILWGAPAGEGQGGGGAAPVWCGGWRWRLPAFRLPCFYFVSFLRSPGERSDTRGRQ